MLKIFGLLLAVVIYLLAAHAIWVWRLARSLQGRIHSNGVRIAMVALTTVTPLLFYYSIGTARRIGETGPGKRRGLVPAAPVGAFAALWLLSSVFDIAIQERASDGRLKPWRIGFNWMLLAGSWSLAVFMIVRVLTSMPTLRAVAIVVAITSVSLALLIAPYP